MPHHAHRFAVLFLLPLVACDGNDSAAAPLPELALAFTAVPEALEPGATVRLRPVFGAGAGRIDPDIGPVTTGAMYEVGPFDSARRYTLTVVRSSGTLTSVLDVPLRYRERVVAENPGGMLRTRHGSVQLADGSVLLVGGASTGPVYWTTAERFDPATGVLTPVGNLSTGRAECALVALPGGGAMQFGGPINANSFELATRVEEWSPDQLAWSVRGHMICNRTQHTATRLADGRILVAGGTAAGGLVSDRDAEVFVPGVGSRAPLGEMVHRRAAHTATVLADGRILFAGGYDPDSGRPVAECELFDPATESFDATGELQVARLYHAAVLLANGSVLCIGGEQPGLVPLRSAEVFDPSTGTWTRTGDLNQPRTEVRALRLGDGQVLVAGGHLDVQAATDQLELWDAASGAFRRVGDRLPGPRSGHSLHLLRDGRAVFFGGDPGTGFPVGMLAFFD